MPAPKRNQQATLSSVLQTFAPTRPVNHVLSLDKYLRSADLLLNQAKQYRAERNEQQLYVMLVRFVSLVVETIPQHRDFRKDEPRYLKLKQLLLDLYFPETERLKLSLDTSGICEPVPHSKNRPDNAVHLTTSNLPQINWESGASTSSAEPPVQDLLDILSGPKPTNALKPGTASMPDAAAAAATTASALASTSLGFTPTNNKHAFFFQQSLPSNLDVYSPPAPPVQPVAERSVVPYPSLDGSFEPPGQVVRPEDQLSAQLPRPSMGPRLGPQEAQVIYTSPDALAPRTCTDHTSTSTSSPPLTSTAAASEGGLLALSKRAQLRDVHVSLQVMETFLRIAAQNTARGIETCGILAGVLSANDSMFTITTLIIPKQEGTSDTVQALNEEDIFDAQFQRQLYPLGWIHTHPTQTCFLSSVDIHTQCGYQTMLDEALAIVMAPSDRQSRCGLFRLSTPGGLKLVQKCNLRGFHTHPSTTTGQDIYEDCPHVYLNEKVGYEVLDLRT